jgi:hypothetical protein
MRHGASSPKGLDARPKGRSLRCGLDGAINELSRPHGLPQCQGSPQSIASLGARHLQRIAAKTARRCPLWVKSRHVEFGKEGISISKSGETTIKFGHLALVGMPLDLDRQCQPSYRNGNGRIVSWPNPRERLWKARDEWHKIVASRTTT